jgi:hypothetical protein
MAELFSKIRLDGQGRIEFVRRLLGGEQVIEQIIADQAPDSLLDSVIAETEKQQAAKAGKLPEETRVGKALIDSILFSPGADLESRENTLWGAINGVTHWVDHQRGRTQDSTLSGAWFGQGAAMKQAAVQVAYDMAGTGGRA